MSAGKGSSRRGTDPGSLRRYAAGWERIFLPKHTRTAILATRRKAPSAKRRYRK